MKINPNDFLPARPHARVTSGEVIRILREKKGWTQEELARRSKISRTMGASASAMLMLPTAPASPGSER